jgi:hypothetical protein
MSSVVLLLTNAVVFAYGAPRTARSANLATWRRMSFAAVTTFFAMAAYPDFPVRIRTAQAPIETDPALDPVSVGVA